jgi:hypothetical protein
MLEELEAQPEDSNSPDYRSRLHDYRLKLQLLKSSLDKLKETKPRIDNGLFVRLMYGRVNIALWKQADRLMFKDGQFSNSRRDLEHRVREAETITRTHARSLVVAFLIVRVQQVQISHDAPVPARSAAAARPDVPLAGLLEEPGRAAAKDPSAVAAVLLLDAVSA